MADRSVSITIGAAFAGGFNAVFGRAQAQLARIGDAVKTLSDKGKTLENLRASEQRAGEGVQSLTARLEKQRSALQAAETRIEKLKAKITEAGDPTGKLAVRLDTAEQAALRARDGIATLDKQLETAKADLAAAATKASEFAKANQNLERTLGRVGTAWKQLEARRLGYERASAALDRNRSERARLRGEALENIAIVGGIYASMRPSIEFDFRLRLMANNADLTDKQLQIVRQRIRQIADDTKQTDTSILEGLSSLIAAGMEFETALSAMPAVGKAATTTGGEIAEFAQTADALNKSLKIDPRDMLSALDALYLAGKEGKFEFRDMAQFFPALAAGMAKFGGRGVAAAAQLAAAAQVARDVTGDASLAATLVDNFLTKLTSPQTLKKFQMFGVDAESAMREGMRRHADPFLLGLGLLRRAIGNDPLSIGKIFEDMEVQKMALALMQHTKRYQDVKAAASKARGELDRDFAKVTEELTIKVKGLGNAWFRFFQSLALAGGGRVGAAIEGLTRLTRAATAFTVEHPRLVGAVVATAGALVTLKIATFGARYAMVIAKEPFLIAGKAIRWLGLQASMARVQMLLMGEAGGVGAAAQLGRIPLLGRLASMFGLVGAAAPAAAAGTTAAGAVAGTATAGFGALIGAAAPVLAIGAALAVLGTIIWKQWEPLKAFFTGIWQGITASMAPVGRALGQVFEPLRPAWQWFKSVLATVFGQTKLTGSEFKSIFWWGQKVGAVLGAVFAGLAVTIGTVIQTLGFLGNALTRLASGDFAGVGRAWKEYKAAMQGYGNMLVGAGQNIIAGPNNAAANRAAAQRELSIPGAKRTSSGLFVVPAPAKENARALGDTITIHAPITIHAAPGQNAQDIAEAARREFERMVRDANARRRSALHD